jgi:hypothetical protein
MMKMKGMGFIGSLSSLENVECAFCCFENKYTEVRLLYISLPEQA